MASRRGDHIAFHETAFSGVYMIHLGRLEGFYWVGTTGGYAAASRAIPHTLSQPAIYQQVKKLEEELDIKLFERVGHGEMRLTPAGRILYRFVQPFFERLPRILRSMANEPYGGRLRIVSASKFLVDLLPKWIMGLRAVRPDIEVELVEASEPDPLVLDRLDADIIIDYFPGGPPQGYAAQEVATTHGCFVVPESWPEVADEWPDIRQLQDRPFVGYPYNTTLSELQARALEQYTIRSHPVAQVGRADAILALVGAGLGFSVLATLEPSGPTRDGVIALAPPGKPIHFPVHAVWPDEAAHPVVQSLLDVIVAQR